ncbi:MAG: hypothetical protein K2X82_03460, partial [Gemmataceae bacterium]|nr:hypothetical protein [Gemmataceae bacterium]
MNVAVVALLGMTAGQPPADTYVPWTDRRVPLPIHYDHDPKAIAQVQLWVSDDGGQLWKKVLAAPPTQKEFLYVAPADGRYWFHIVVVDLKGGQDPPNLAAEPPAQMVLIDTKPPQVLVTAARRDGESITVEWKVEDQFPNDAATQVSFRPLGSPDAAWKEVRLPPGPPGGVRFPAGTTGPVQVRVAVADRVGQTAEAVKDFPAAGAAGPTSTSLSAGTGAPAAGPTTPVPPPDSLAPAPPATGGPLAPAAPPP